MNDFNGQDITCVIAVYNGTELFGFKLAIESILRQSVPPMKILIVVDGRVYQKLADYINFIKGELIDVIYLSQNQGPGHARHIGILHSKTRLIAIMDSDDLSVNNRFELQLDAFNSNEISVCGGAIQEFDKKSDLQKRILPSENSDIIKFSRLRSPINNVTAMFKKEDYLKTGGYPNFRIAEDYCLWLRFISRGFVLCNLKEVLVKVRFDENTLGRRNGFLLLKYDFLCQKENYKSGNISFFRMLINLVVLLPFRFLPSTVLRFLYKKVLRAN